jgi:flagellar basal-body rod protein FlgB
MSVHTLLTMTLDQIPLFSMLKDRMGYLSQRQTVISENVANSDTPGYTPRDLEPFKISMPTSGSGASGGGLAMAPIQTTGAHVASIVSSIASNGGSTSQTWKPQAAPDSETRLDGNKVVLEEQMMKLNEARTSYDAAVSFYQKSMGLIELALRAPGKGA